MNHPTVANFETVGAGGRVKPGFAGRRLSPAVGVCGRPFGAGARGILPPPPKICGRKFRPQKRTDLLTSAFQEIIFIVNKCSNEQKATKFPSFLLVGGRSEQ